MAKLKVTQTGSPIRRTDDQKATLKGLGLDKDLKTAGGATRDAATSVGKTLAERAKKAGVNAVVFDRGGFLFHGRVKALADAAREGGLEF